jgi:hypothetical protein
LEDKIAIVEGGYKHKDTDKIFGITPQDYEIFKRLGRIDGTGHTKKICLKDDKHESSDEGGGTDGESSGVEITADEAFENLVATVTDKIIISHESTFYRVEQAFVCFLCVIFGYFYIFMACFGNEPVAEDYIISNK